MRLTTDPADDVSPAFSPDGRSIGFVRVSKEHATFIVIPAIGGPERIVAEVAIPPDVFFGPGPSSALFRRAIPPNVFYGPGPLFAWFPNGNSVVTDGLALFSTESGEIVSLTTPPTKSLPDSSPGVRDRIVTVKRCWKPEFPSIAQSRRCDAGCEDSRWLGLRHPTSASQTV